MSEPITLYCVEDYPYGGRTFLPGDVVVLASPSTVRDFIASGKWSYTPPDEPQEAPPIEVQEPPVWQRPAAKPKSGKR